ncbi:MAG TPA: hypothetical protein VJY33_19790, partial [Isosphaeraceae bacterium]|nr:hypothetical protein [Isosphaeraceae bacterium]
MWVGVTREIQLLERLACGKIVVGPQTLASQPFKLLGRHDHDRVLPAANSLRPLRERPVHQLAQATLGFGEIPFLHGFPPVEVATIIQLSKTQVNRQLRVSSCFVGTAIAVYIVHSLGGERKKLRPLIHGLTRTILLHAF